MTTNISWTWNPNRTIASATLGNYSAIVCNGGGMWQYAILDRDGAECIASAHYDLTRASAFLKACYWLEACNQMNNEVSVALAA
jgi:hypothetical protein